MIRLLMPQSLSLLLSIASYSFSLTSAFSLNSNQRVVFGYQYLHQHGHDGHTKLTSASSSKLYMAKEADLPTIVANLNDAIQKCQPEFIKTCKVMVALDLDADVDSKRLRLIATNPIKKGDVALAMPYDEQIIFTPELARKNVYQNILPAKYDSWTGDNGMLALLVLNELAKVASKGTKGINKPTRKIEAANLIEAWIAALPSFNEMKDKNMHPYLWNEDDQEILQSSSTKNIYKLLDDMEDDVSWLEEKIFSQDRDKFPQEVQLNGESYPCFNGDGFAWAMAIVVSRSVFIDGSSRIIPIMDMANHDDFGVQEVQQGFMGTFGTTKGVVVKAGSTKSYGKGQEVFVSYGPKSAAEYLLEHGFLPKASRSLQTSVGEITFEIDQDDRFYDDKLDVLEFETYDNAPMEPIQSFDAVSELGRDGEPDPAMIQFLRLLKLNAKDAFMLESIFRKEVWEFVSMPVSEQNERDVLDAVADACNKGLAGMQGVESSEDDNENSPAQLCAIVRASETKALSRTLEYVNREKEALDLKEYYQERRLKDLGLNSDWNPDEAPTGGDAYGEDDLSFGQARAPGSLDW